MGVLAVEFGQLGARDGPPAVFLKLGSRFMAWLRPVPWRSRMAFQGSRRQVLRICFSVFFAGSHSALSDDSGSDSLWTLLVVSRSGGCLDNSRYRSWVDCVLS